MHASHFVAWGLLLAVLLCLASEGKPVPQPQQKSLRTLLGDELSEFLASDESGADRSPKNGKSGSRLLRDLRLDTRSRAAWTRLLNDYPNPRKYKGIHKKGLSKGCFGLKLDRIGAMSGLGC
ncbi:C-type natriuretic peptide [Ambystoma mexicanum]|uniref:C-type natriuretic peptide n=1 Tax=Ambystoma mexicanum TaxID=8296 RepID=UPI0037E7C6BA